MKSQYKSINPDKIKRILIRSTNWIGDAVMTTPAIRSIRHSFPESEIYILVKPWVAPVFKYCPHIDHILLYDSEGKHKGITGKFKLVKELKQYHFDAAILLQNAFEAAFISFLARIPKRIGYSRDGRGFLLTHSIICSKEIRKIHQTGYYLNILTQTGLTSQNPDLELFVGDEYSNQAADVLKQNKIETDKKLIGINPSATYGPAKQWSFERYAGLADKILEKYDGTIIIFGGPDDKKLGDEISGMMKFPTVNLSGKTSLGQAIALIKLCNLFITNDSGLMHVSAALDTPMVAIFGSTNSITTGPLSSNSRIVRVPVDCSPCLKPECPKGHLECMDSITIDMVYDAVIDLIEADQ